MIVIWCAKVNAMSAASSTPRRWKLRASYKHENAIILISDLYVSCHKQQTQSCTVSQPRARRCSNLSARHQRETCAYKISQLMRASPVPLTTVQSSQRLQHPPAHRQLWPQKLADTSAGGSRGVGCAGVLGIRIPGLIVSRTADNHVTALAGQTYR